MPFSTWSHEFGELKQSRPALAALIAGAIGPALLWLTSLQAVYALSAPACRAQQEWWLYAAVLAPLPMFALLAAWVARKHRTAIAAGDAHWPGWLARFGLMSCAFFALVTLSMAIPLWWLDPCL